MSWLSKLQSTSFPKFTGKLFMLQMVNTGTLERAGEIIFFNSYANQIYVTIANYQTLNSWFWSNHQSILIGLVALGL